MPQTQAPNHQGGSRHQGPLCAALNTRGGLIYPRVALIAGVLPSSAHSTTRKYRQHTHVTAAASRLCKQKSSCQVLRHDPGLSPVCSFVRAHLPRLFLAARITHCERVHEIENGHGCPEAWLCVWPFWHAPHTELPAVTRTVPLGTATRRNIRYVWPGRSSRGTPGI